ncbi:type II secretion system F family protein [Naasia sp. SYSU D00948]|uniref:type II secretion system F family protein n=1 Tax=Naasia sp. SYSU D00948 TaxID=2817379 RepID=UPI001B316B06|nr:type II secretion system F family protein [Naasia sp. SYSU D00948]
MSPILFYAGVGLALIALFVVVFLVIAPPAPRVPLERRVAPGTTHVSALTKITDRTIAVIDGVLKRRKSGMFGEVELELASVKMTPSAFVLMVSCTAVVLGGVGVLLGGFTLWTILLVPVFAALAPLGAKIVLGVRAGSRRSKFATQLDDCLTLIAGSIRAGHGFLRALDGASAEMEAPMSEELARVVNEARIGRDPDAALDSVAARMRNDDFRWVAQAIAINREVGGNLSNVLEQTANTIRERNQIRRQVKALSAEGRLSAIILILLPIVVTGFLLVIQPGYFANFFSNIFGILAIVVAVVLLVLGSIWMLAVVRVKF